VELFLVLGCWGRRDNDFISCNGVENRILKIEDHLEHYQEIMDYLDNCRLFDRATFDGNSVRSIISYIQDKFDQPTRRLWSESRYSLLHKFLSDHRNCGVFLKLVLIEDTVEEKTQLKVIRGSKK
jgi:hypothetical protein